MELNFQEKIGIINSRKKRKYPKADQFYGLMLLMDSTLIIKSLSFSGNFISICERKLGILSYNKI